MLLGIKEETMRGLTIFGTKKDSPPAGPPPAEMRGRAGEISDPSAFGWEVMWEALKTEPPDDSSTLTQELGLDHEELIPSRYGGSDWATEFSGTRHGRRVALRMGVIPRIRGNGYNEVQVNASLAPFQLCTEDGRPTVQTGTTPELEGILAGLARAPEVWRKLELQAGPEGIVSRRPVTAHPQGYLYDLWLIERLADQLES
jgi:hypothetical protein